MQYLVILTFTSIFKYPGIENGATFKSVVTSLSVHKALQLFTNNVNGTVCSMDIGSGDRQTDIIVFDGVKLHHSYTQHYI